VTGAGKHLLVSPETGECQWSSRVPDNSWTVGDPSALQSLEAYAAVLGTRIPGIAPMAQARAFEVLLGPDHSVRIPWRMVMTTGDFQVALQSVLQAAQSVLCSLGQDRYGQTYLRARGMLLGLNPATVDQAKINRYIRETEGGPSVASALRSFLPKEGSTAPPITYNQAATVTGRLTVRTGPSILTLPARYRDILSSRFRGGSVVQVDFVSLEPRVARYVAGDEAPTDIYSHMCGALFDGEMTRDKVKLATISALYGMSSRRLTDLLTSESSAKTAIRQIRRYFSVGRLESQLQNELSALGSITSAMGRSIRPDTTTSHILVSHYIQSTAADVALLGFAQLTDRLEELGINAIPLYVIHDALLLDVSPEDLECLRDEVGRGVDLPLGKFPIGMTSVSSAV